MTRRLSLAVFLPAVLTLLNSPPALAGVQSPADNSCPHLVSLKQRAETRAADPKHGTGELAPDGSISGAEQPDRIPDEVALSLYLTTLVPGRSSPFEEIRVRTTLAHAGFDEAEAATVLRMAQDLVGKFRRLDERATVLRQQALTPARAHQSGSLATLQAERDALASESLAALEQTLGAEVGGRLRRHLAEYVKPRMSMLPSSHVPTHADLFTQSSAGDPAPLSYCPGGGGGLAPYCRDGCSPSRPCDKLCRADDETCTTCGEYGNCSGGGGGGGGGADMYAYDDADSDGTVVWATGAAQISYEGSPEVRVDVAMHAPSGDVSINCSGCGTPERVTSVYGSIEDGIYGIDLDFYFCTEQAPRVRRSRSVSTGRSRLWYVLDRHTQELGLFSCYYNIIVPCPVNCSAQLRTNDYKHVPACPAYVYEDVFWRKVDDRAPRCSRSPFGVRAEEGQPRQCRALPPL